MASQKNNINIGLFIFSLGLVISGLFFFSKANQNTLTTYYDVFFPLSIGIPVLWVLSLIVEKYVDKRVSVYNETVPQNKLTRLISKKPFFVKLLIVGGGLSVLFSLGAVALGSPIIDLPPAFSEADLPNVNFYDKLFHQGAVPGYYEESGIYLICLGLKYMFLAFGLFKNPKLFIFLLLIISALGGAGLTIHHRVAYGSDESAYVGIFMFEWIVQFFNLFTGAFISWLPHMVHNAVVIQFSLVGFAVAGGLFMFIPMKMKRWKPSKSY